LLIDTYDTIEGARNAVEVAREMASRGQKLLGVRIDSGDLAAQARAVRKVFDDANLPELKIVGSSGLDEFELADLTRSNTPFDSYGIGTKMGMSADAPWADMSYKLVEYERRPLLKLSPGKTSWPGKKQVFRLRDSEGKFVRDVIGLRGENLAGERLLKEVLRDGKMLHRQPSLTESRNLFAEEFAALPEGVKRIRDPSPYPVAFSRGLEALRRQATDLIQK
jgi:nicotinate phosphoribosyltransferase